MSLIAIFSDLHDNLNNLDLFLTRVRAQKVTTLVFLGDLTSAETLDYLSSKWEKRIYLVGGNADFFKATDCKKHSQLIYKADYLDFNYGNFRFLIAHKPLDLKKILTLNSTYDFAFYGHTHTPWIKNENGVVIANPGNLKDGFGQATYALLDTENGHLELKRLND
ncbi:YfcE family phosphodiesterase [Candidatus Falkowbacteria bacterium]|nr:YfcE family phosphodiesterase [Candidatus Falkowbacteria bacterium]